jgi:hypothetical protein
MIRDPIASTNIASAGYDEASQTMEVEFIGSGVYQYYNVGSDLYQQFLQSASKGQFLNIYIKNAYPYSRVG